MHGSNIGNRRKTNDILSMGNTFYIRSGFDTTHEIIKIIEDGWNQFFGLTFERPAENVAHIRKVSLDGAGKSTTSIDNLHVDIIIITVL